MPKQGTRLSKEAIQSIRDMLENGSSGAEIGRKLNLSKNTICSYIRQFNMRPKMESKTYGKRKEAIADDYSTLPDEILFDSKKFPVF